jgi:hypothetical protein
LPGFGIPADSTSSAPGDNTMNRTIARLGKKTGLDENEVKGFFKIGLSGLVAVALSVFAGSAKAGAGDTADFRKLLDKPQAKGDLPEPCRLKPDGGTCKALLWKYYFDQKTNRCKEFAYGGCDGVVPFETKQECEQTCLQPKPEPVVRDDNCGPFPGYPCGTKYFTVSIRDFRRHSF